MKDRRGSSQALLLLQRATEGVLYGSPPNFLFSIKEFPALCLRRLVQDSPWLHVTKCNSLLFPNKPIFAEEISGWFLFDVHIVVIDDEALLFGPLKESPALPIQGFSVTPLPYCSQVWGGPKRGTISPGNNPVWHLVLSPGHEPPSSFQGNKETYEPGIFTLSHFGYSYI